MRALQEVVDALLQEATVDAVVRDGWPQPMVEAGFAMHRTTWDLELLDASLQQEVRQLPATSPPSAMTHIWPALPGAGVTPVLAATLLGVGRQTIRPSGRGAHFAQRVAEVWRDVDVQLAGEIARGDRVVVSGSDETVDAVIAAHGAANVVGYGDRESFAVVDAAAGDVTRYVDALARDIVMWFGRGCFSAHAVIFLGDRDAGHAFGAALAEAISRREALWCPEPDVGMLATRMQRLAVAQFETTVWPARLGWVELRDRWERSGADRPANVVTLCVTDELDRALAVPPRNRQGVAWCGLTPPRAIAGVTRVCAPGQLQAPPADWPHDGVSNAAALLGFRSGRIGVS